jgi:hypothetical protein
LIVSTTQKPEPQININQRMANVLYKNKVKIRKQEMTPDPYNQTKVSDISKYNQSKTASNFMMPKHNIDSVSVDATKDNKTYIKESLQTVDCKYQNLFKILKN